MMAYLLFILSLSAILFYGYGVYAAIAFQKSSHAFTSDFHPPITILKPVCGLDNNTYENFASFCQQDYPEYEIIFSVRDADDPCVNIVKQIITDFSAVDITLVISDRTIGTNLKVCNLDNAQKLAKYPILLLADSDVQVASDYLKRVIQPMRDPEVGVITCLYRPLTQGWVANLEALGISTEYLASVLVARKLEGIRFALGPTIVIRQATLDSFGGFEAIADYLADDFQLGYLPSQNGYKVILSDYIVNHVITSHHWMDLMQRQIRWYLCTRVSRSWGYWGLIFSHGTVTSLGFCVITLGSKVGWTVLLITWTFRLIMAWVVGVRLLQDPVVEKLFLLIPLRDLISFALWCYCIVQNDFVWRGRRLKLTKEGKLLKSEIKCG